MPVVTTNIGDSAYIVGENGVILNDTRPVSLANAWSELLSISDEKRLNQMGAQARDRIVEHFGIQKIFSIYKDLYIGA